MMKLTNEAGFVLLLAVIDQAEKDLDDRDQLIRKQAQAFFADMRSVFAYSNSTPRRPRQISARRVTFSRENMRRVRHETI